MKYKTEKLITIYFKTTQEENAKTQKFNLWSYNTIEVVNSLIQGSANCEINFENFEIINITATNGN